MLKNLKEKFLLNYRELALVLLFGSCLLITIHNRLIKPTKQYQLTILVAYGPMLYPVEGAIVTEVTHEIDGSVCFVTKEDERACAKSSNYFLKELNVK